MGNADTINPQSFIEQILFSTLKIELLNARDELQSIGTGFLLKVDFPQNPSESLILLVSNKHVLATSERFNISQLRKLRRRQKERLLLRLFFKACGVRRRNEKSQFQSQHGMENHNKFGSPFVELRKHAEEIDQDLLNLVRNEAYRHPSGVLEVSNVAWCTKNSSIF